MFGVKCVHSTSIHSSTYRHSPTYNLQRKNWNKINALVYVPKEETHHESDDLNRINLREFTCLPLFALLVTHDKRNVSLACQSIWKKAEFAPAGVQARSPSRTFYLEVTSAGGKFQSKNYTGRNVNSYINIYECLRGPSMVLLFSPVDSRWREYVAAAKKFGKRECCRCEEIS